MLRVVFGNSDFFFLVICYIGSGTSQINDPKKENYDQAPTHLVHASLFLQTTISLQVFLDASSLYTHYIAFFSIDTCAAWHPHLPYRALALRVIQALYFLRFSISYLKRPTWYYVTVMCKKITITEIQ